jgi:uncharacterized protein with NRDE domain
MVSGSETTVCTLVLLYGLLKDYPVVALHNRYLGKDTLERPPRRLNGNTVAPLDVESGGTWMGVNDSGLLLAITNQETQRLPEPGRSRGLLALDILNDHDTAEEAKEHLLDPGIRGLYRTGNFTVLDPQTGWHVVWDRDTHVYPLAEGVYAVSTITMVPGIAWSDHARNIWVDAEKRRARAYELLSGYQPSSVGEAVAELMRVSADHGWGRSQSSICWHSPEYRQTSSTIMAVAAEPGDPLVYYCEGNACENHFKDYSKKQV